MPMGRINDDLSTNTKVMHLLSMPGGREAMGLWVIANSWCNKQLTDGHVPAFIVVQLGWKTKSADLLVTSGLWRKETHEYVFHDWEDHNELRDSVLRKRAEDARRKKNVRAVNMNEKAILRSMSSVDSTAESGVESTAESTMESGPPSPSPIPSEKRVVAADAATLPLLPHEPGPDPKPAKPRDEAKLLWTATLKAESVVRKIPAPAIGGKIRDEVIRMSREHAANTGEAFPSVLRTWVAGGLDVHVQTGKPPQWALKDFRPYSGSVGMRRVVHAPSSPPGGAAIDLDGVVGAVRKEGDGFDAEYFDAKGNYIPRKVTHTW